MPIRYAISLWDFDHYTFVPPIEELIPMIRQAGFGLELWSSWHHGRDVDFFSPEWRRILKPLVEGMPLSFHGSGRATTFEAHCRQIDAAADLGAAVIVIHAAYVPLPRSDRDPGSARGRAAAPVNEDLLGRILDYAGKAGVRIALENGSLDGLKQAAARFPSLGLCLDIGHLYNGGLTMSAVAPLKHRLIHLHLQEPLPKREASLPLSCQDHYMLGIGGIPRRDWELLASMLRETDFNGMAVFELRPLNVFQNAMRGEAFLEQLMPS